MIYGISAAALLLALSPLSVAQAQPAREDLQFIADLFVDRIGRGLDKADALLSGDRLRYAELEAQGVIPDGDLLLLQGYVSGKPKARLNREIVATRMNDRLMISLEDFMIAAELAISVSAEKKLATGWFIREDQTFILDANENTVTLSGVTTPFDPREVQIEGNDFFVSSRMLEKWLSMQLTLDLSSMGLIIDSEQPLPVQQRLARNRKNKYETYRMPDASLPLQEEPLAMASMPFFDVSISGGTQRNDKDDEFSNRASWSVLGSGDLFGLTSQTFVNGNMNDDEFNPVNAVRQSFSYDDPDGKLFGMQQLSFGDVQPVSLPIAGTGSTGQGVRITNRPFGGITTLGTLDIRGDAQPGWDVELFRNDISLGLQKVSDTGEYNFPSVFLFAGNNVLKLVFYGPQGELREEVREIFSGSSVGLGGAWDAAVTRTNMITYQKDKRETLIDGDLNLSAKYEWNVPWLGTMRAGLSSFPVTDGTITGRKNFLISGITTYVMDTLVSGDAALDVDDNTYSGNVTLRRNFGEHQTGLVFRHQSEDFSLNAPTGTALGQNNVQLYMTGPAATDFMGFNRLTYNINSFYSLSSDDSSQLITSASIGGRVGNIGMSAGLNYNVSEDPFGNKTDFKDRVTGSLGISGYYEKARWRLSSTYDVQPVELQSLIGNVVYPLTPEIEAQADLEHQVESSLTKLDLSANWLHDKFTLSPRLSTDSEGKIALTTNLRFGLARDPYSGSYDMSRRNVTSGGAFASRVFLDTNGDGLLDAGDEMLDEAEVRSVQSSRRGYTDETGHALVAGLTRGRRTDIVVNRDSLPDVFYMSMNEGVSVIPRPGHVSKVDFPVVIAGEIDGQAQFITEDDRVITARNIKISLYTPEGKEAYAVRAENDGYYSLTDIRPGVYYLTIDTGLYGEPGYIMPQQIAFGPAGDTFYGQAISITSPYSIPFTFSAANNRPGERKERVPRAADIRAQSVILHLGSYHSQVAMTVGWYKFKLQLAGIARHFELARPLGEVAPVDKPPVMAIPLKPKEPMSIARAARTCEALIDQGYTCGVEVITIYHDTVPDIPPTPVAKSDDKGNEG